VADLEPAAPAADRAQAVDTLLALGRAFEELVVRGLASTGADDLRRLSQLGDALGRAGAGYVAGTIGDVVHQVREQADGAARSLLRAQTASRVFERVLSLEAAAETLGAGAEPAPPPAPFATPAPPAVDARKLVPVLEELAGLIEGLIDAGMTTASSATKAKLDATFQEASRLRLLRLAAALRYINDECGRFLAESPQFSPRRLAFFANRAWLIARGLQGALARDDRAALARLLWTATPTPVKQLTVGVLGVQKRGLLDGSAAFEFRMRALADAPGIPRGTRLLWSCVFGARPKVPPEAFLHLPQPQKFLPRILLEPTEIVITDAAVALDDTGAGRIMLGPKSTVTAGGKLKPRALAGFLAWDPAVAAARVRAHPISPLDLEVELHEEIALDDYELRAPIDSAHRPEQVVYPLAAGGRAFDAIAPAGPEGEALREALDGLRKKTQARPLLFGVMHYEWGRLVFQPLAAIDAGGPRHLMIPSDKIDLAGLMKTLDFTS
jgi:hypothetical protein